MNGIIARRAIDTVSRAGDFDSIVAGTARDCNGVADVVDIIAVIVVGGDYDVILVVVDIICVFLVRVII